MQAVIEYVKNASKQLIVAAVVGVIVFFVWPGATVLLFVGMAIGIIAGNLYPAVEAIAEKAIAKIGK